MPDDRVRIADTREWFMRVADDLRGAEVDLAARPPLIKDALFHCQQAVEKALKGFLTWHDSPFNKTHELVQLGSQCAKVDPTLEPLTQRTAPLTRYAWKFRYPGASVEPAVQEAQESLALARELVGAVLARLPAEVRP